MKASEVKEGTKVYISKDCKSTHYNYGWEGPMDKFLGTRQVVQSITGDKVTIVGDSYHWHVRDLKKAEPSYNKPIKMTGEKLLFDINELD